MGTRCPIHLLCHLLQLLLDVGEEEAVETFIVSAVLVQAIDMVLQEATGDMLLHVGGSGWRRAGGRGLGLGLTRQFSWTQSLSCRHVSPKVSGSWSARWHSPHTAMGTMPLSPQAWQQGDSSAWQRHIPCGNAHLPPRRRVASFLGGMAPVRDLPVLWAVLQSSGCGKGTAALCGVEASLPFLGFTSGAKQQCCFLDPEVPGTEGTRACGA